MELCLGLVGSTEWDESSFEKCRTLSKEKSILRVDSHISSCDQCVNQENTESVSIFHRLGFTPYHLIRLHLMLWVLAHETSPHTDLDTPGLVDLDSAHWGVWGWSGGNVRSLDILCGVGKSCKGFPPLTHQFVTFYPNSPLHNCL